MKKSIALFFVCSVLNASDVYHQNIYVTTKETDRFIKCLSTKKEKLSKQIIEYKNKEEAQFDAMDRNLKMIDMYSRKMNAEYTELQKLKARFVITTNERRKKQKQLQCLADVEKPDFSQEWPPLDFVSIRYQQFIRNGV